MVDRNGRKPPTGPVIGMATVGLVASSVLVSVSYAAKSCARSSNGLGASFSSFGKAAETISYLGQAPPEVAVFMISPNWMVVRSMGHMVLQVASLQVNSDRSIICAAKKSSNFKPGELSRVSFPISSTAHSPIPHAPIAPGLGGTTISRPVTAAKVHARQSLLAGFPWKKIFLPRFRWPITRFK